VTCTAINTVTVFIPFSLILVFFFACQRFILSGEELKSSIISNSARVFHYDTEYNLDKEMVRLTY